MLVRILPVCLVALLGLAASPVPRIQFTDTRLKNGLRVIVSEDHAAPVFSIAVNYNVGSRDERKGRTGFRPPLRAHDVQGLRERRSRRASVPDVHERREHERHDQQGPDDVLRDACRPTSSISRSSSRPTGCARSTSPRRTSTTSATPSRKSAGSASTTSRTARRSRRSTSSPTRTSPTSTRSIGSMADLDAASVEDVAAFFKTYYAPNNAVHRDRRRRGREVDAREGPEVLRADSVAARAAAGRHDRAAADRGAPRHARGSARAAAAHRHGLQGSAELLARRRRADGAGARSSRAAAAPVLRGDRPREAARDERRPPDPARAAGPGLFSVVGTRCPARRSRISKRRSTRRSRS